MRGRCPSRSDAGRQRIAHPQRVRGGGGFLQACERAGACAIEHAVVDADLVEIAAAQKVIAALHLVRRHHAAGEAELVQCSVEVERAAVGAGRTAVHACGFLAVHIQAYAPGFVPGKRNVDPVAGAGNFVELERDAGAREVGVGDEGVEAVAVPVDAQPGHVPTGVVGVADAEDHERRFADRVARTPEETERAALGVEVAGGIPRQHAVVGPFDGVAAFAGGHQRDLVAEIGHAIAAGDIGLQTLVGRDAEQQLRCIGSGSTHRQRNQHQHIHPPLLHAHCLTPQKASPHGVTARRIFDTAWR